MPLGMIRLSGLIRADSLLEPLERIPCVLADQVLGDCAASLLTSDAPYWAIVEADQRFVGLVSTFYLRKILELSAIAKLPEKVPALTANASESLWHQVKSPVESGSELHRISQPLQTQIERLRSSLPTELLLDERDSRTAVRSLMQFLEQLPLPLMLQTSTGDVVARNHAWTQQLEELSDPRWVQRDAAAVLEQSMIERVSLEQPAAQLCQIGADTNTCLCLCPLKNGQERMLQFVKVRLAAASAEGAPEWPFQLAALAGELHVHPAIADLWLVLAQDVTEQHQLARELAAKNADLVQLNRLKDEFLACISHELRTPLTAVLGLSSLLKDQLSGSMNERQVRYAQLIHRSGRHLMTIVNDILDLTRIETGQLELNLEPVAIAAACHRAFEQAKQIYLEEKKPESQPEQPEAPQLPSFMLDVEAALSTFMADETRLRQILVHLLSNALKFTPDTGAIGLRVSQWEGWIAFTVWDTGIGIPADKQHLIFQKFQQLENPLTRRYEGAGLGLVLAQRLARLHGGDISFTSKENEGSQFTLLLPPVYPEPTQALLGKTPTRNRLVLVVEAVVRSLELLSEQLGEFGYRVMIARSGTEAVEKARRLQPCAIFLNPLLPTLSGWDALTLLKADPQTKEIPVVVTSTRGDREQAYRNQADAVLSFPIARQALRQVLNQLTSDEEPVSAIAPPSSLVVLRLSPTRYGDLRHLPPGEEIDLNALLHHHNYRVIEADDLEQAELLAQVWKPNVVLLDPVQPDPTSYLKLLTEQTFLSSLPLVTLDLATTKAANQTAGLTVFPCLAPLDVPAEGAAVLQVIQVAAGFAWRPLVLAVDSLLLQEHPPQETEWLQAVMQYLQAAGFRGMIAKSRSEVLQKLEAQSVDVLLLNWHHTTLDESLREQISMLQRLRGKTAIVAIDQTAACEELSTCLADSDVLPRLPMEELLNHLNQVLTN